MQRITYFERQIIESGLRCNKSARTIARSLNRDHRVVQREVNRNKGEHTPYTASSAQHIANARQKKKNIPKLEKLANSDLRNYIVSKLHEDWSPEQIAGIIAKQSPPEVNGKSIVHESIYKYIYEGEGRWENLWLHLRKGRVKRRKQRARKPQKVTIPHRISIHERPDNINSKTIFGHWESDTVECGQRQKQKISVQYERKSMLVRIHKVEDKSAKQTELAIRKSIESLPTYFWESITFDNGGESATHVDLRSDYDLQTFHCDAYASWQKGGVENVNGLIRQYIPRSTDLSSLDDKDTLIIQERLNNRPRKKLNYLTPNQISAQEGA